MTFERLDEEPAHPGQSTRADADAGGRDGGDEPLAPARDLAPSRFPLKARGLSAFPLPPRPACPQQPNEGRRRCVDASTPSFTRSLAHSLTHSLTRSLTHSLAHPFARVCVLNLNRNA